MQASKKSANKLIHEKSPYLLQHAYNPVKWFPWGEEAFEKAKSEDKPIFLSIGYSTCHWCHVMEEESFTDNEVAEILNENFISIKIDREERPDIDSIYMRVCQATTGSGGWPLTTIMTWNQKPFFSGTYLPKHNRQNMLGLCELLVKITNLWKTDRQYILKNADEIIDYISKNDVDKKSEVSEELISNGVEGLMASFDKKYGGFSDAPKFPVPHNLIFLEKYYELHKNKDVLNAVEQTLINMHKGGLFDHIGFGFCRYSTDEKWLVPHFEKMLYDNSLLSIAYLESFQITKKEIYKNIAVNTLKYMKRELYSPEKAFYSAQDADSEGKEGLFYIFKYDEIVEILGEAEGLEFNKYFNISQHGNFEGYNIPNLIGNTGLHKDFENSINKIYEYRKKRMKLHLDDKYLTSWNAMAVIAFAKAYKIIGDKEYLETAKSTADFIKEKMTFDIGELAIRYKDGEIKGNGIIDDYAYYIWALLEVYNASFDIKYLEYAKIYADLMIDLFFDSENGGFYLYSKNSEKLIFKPKEIYDSATPSGNSVAAYVLAKLSSIFNTEKINSAFDLQNKFIAGNIEKHPYYYTFSLHAFLSEIKKELIVVLNNDQYFEEIEKIIFEKNIFDMVIIKTRENTDKLAELLPHTKNYSSDKDLSFFICENKACSAPFHTMEEFKIL